MGFSASKRFAALIVLALGLAVPAAAQADTPAHTDVMFVFDTTGSMGGALEEAKKEIKGAMTQLSASLPDVRFGLSEVNDYDVVLNRNFEYDYGVGEGYEPWVLKVPIGPSQQLVSDSLQGLFADGGGDGPEAYGRGLFESTTNPAVGWRPGTRGIIVLIADNVPHDDELNLGIPAASWVESPFDTGIDPGVDSTVGTADDLDWQAVLNRLATDGRPLEYVDFHGKPAFIPYWQAWAGGTGGTVITAKGEDDLGSKLVEAVKLGAALPPCPSGQVRNSESVCVPIPPPPVSNSFKIEPRISCAKGCYVVEVKIVFDSAGRVIAESVLNEEPARSSAVASASKKVHKPKAKAQIKKLSQTVNPGVNTLKLKLTGSAKKALKKKGSVKLRVKFAFTPTGGTTKSVVHTFNVKAPVKKPAKKTGSGK